MGRGENVEKDDSMHKSAITLIREEGKLPTASSQFSFSDPPTEHWNKAPVFSEARRMNHAGSGSFLGTFYHQAEEKGISYPGPGTYHLAKSTVLDVSLSCTRPSTFDRRSKISCAPMQGSRMNASLAGADQLLLPPGPDFQAAPKTDMDRAAGAKGFLTASFASETGRFVEPSMINGAHEIRKFERRILNNLSKVVAVRSASSSAHSAPGSMFGTGVGLGATSAAAAAAAAADHHHHHLVPHALGAIHYPRVKTAPWVPGLPHPLPRTSASNPASQPAARVEDYQSLHDDQKQDAYGSFAGETSRAGRLHTRQMSRTRGGQHFTRLSFGEPALSDEERRESMAQKILEVSQLQQQQQQRVGMHQQQRLGTPLSDLNRRKSMGGSAGGRPGSTGGGAGGGLRGRAPLGGGGSNNSSRPGTGNGGGGGGGGGGVGDNSTTKNEAADKNKNGVAGLFGSLEKDRRVSVASAGEGANKKDLTGRGLLFRDGGSGFRASDGSEGWVDLRDGEGADGGNFRQPTSEATMGRSMQGFSFSGPMSVDLTDGFVGPDPKTNADALRLTKSGRDRRMVATERGGDVRDVQALEGFKPPNTTALRFY